ncbi:MAG: carbonic anhydrase [Alphaproteobacteria bacterium]|nr:carbonic anhydrase [Alphaproteobacteria bacterium]MBF0250919.1 carbonic anhydrase [Alphaproteobacteria bacterium]
MPVLEKLAAGYRAFRTLYFETNKTLYRRLVKDGQKPKVAVIACSDSRVDPALVLQAEPGDIFSIRNVANLVPPFEVDGDVSYHGTSAALEFAVTCLGVEHVVVFGHAHCAGINAMVQGQQGGDVAGTFIPAWTSIAARAFERAKHEEPCSEGEDLLRCCERNAVLVSLDNLMSFPFIHERVADGRLQIHGWYLDIAEGALATYDPATKTFVPVS